MLLFLHIYKGVLKMNQYIERVIADVKKRDGDKDRYGGNGVMEAVRGVCKTISPALCGSSACEQYELDKIL